MRKLGMCTCVLLAWAALTIPASAQTTLVPGDVAFSGYSSSGTDEFSFVLLRGVTAGTTISFTDRGWLAVGGFRSGEGAFELTLDADYPCGSEFRAVMSPLEVRDDSGAVAGMTIGGGLQLSTSGDQLFAYQGVAPTAGDESGFLAGLQMNGGWDADATSTNTSTRPSSLSEGVHALALAPEMNNARYDCGLVSADPAVLAAAVHDPAGWLADDAAPFDLSVTCGFSCASPPPPSAPQSVAQQKCANVMLTQLGVASGIQVNEVAKCVKSQSKGKIPSAEVCSADDATGKVAKARTKITDLFGKKCVELPDFGFAGDVALADAAIAGGRGLWTDLLGVAFDGSIVPSEDKAAAKCQQAVMASAKKCFAARLKEYAKCVKSGLKDGSITGAAGLAACVGADPKGKIAVACDLGVFGDKKLDGVRKSLAKQCIGIDVAPGAVFAACASTTGVEDAHACIEPRVACRACRTSEAASAVAVPCDEIDDGIVNGSCLI